MDVLGRPERGTKPSKLRDFNVKKTKFVDNIQNEYKKFVQFRKENFCKPLEKNAKM